MVKSLDGVQESMNPTTPCPASEIEQQRRAFIQKLVEIIRKTADAPPNIPTGNPKS